MAHASVPGTVSYGLRSVMSSVTAGYNDVWTHTGQYDGMVIPPTDLHEHPLFSAWLHDDFHLSHGSPCIDAGTPVDVDDDFDGQTRPLGSGPDIGFDEVAALAYAKSVDVQLATPGAELVYTLVITNPDPHALAPGSLLSDVLPVNVTYASGPTCTLPVCAYLAAKEAVAWTGEVPTDTQLTMVYTATANYGLANGTEIINAAYFATAAEGGWTPQVTTTIYSPVLTLTKEAEGTPVAGLPFTYTVTVSNESPYVPAQGVVVVDAVPDDGHWVSGGKHENGLVALTYPAIAANDQAYVSWVVSTCQTSLTNRWYRVVTSTAHVKSDWGPTLVTDLSPPSLGPSFTLSSDTVQLGEGVTFTDISTFDGAPLVAWSWDFGDGQVGSGTPVSHGYDAAKSYTVTLTITDACGFAASRSVADAVTILGLRIYLPIVMKDYSLSRY